jgi:choice-of-anchor B domain-containing protein
MHPVLMVASAIALGAVAAAPATAQALNCRMWSNVNKFPGAVPPVNNYTGCWGMVGSNGREYALVAARTGTIVYDCNNPASPVETAFIPGPPPTFGIYFWREVRELDGWVYVSSEHGPVQVIDMRAPATPVLAGTFGQTAHALSIDKQRKHLWLNGAAGNGARVYDLAANPTNPPQIAQYTASYVHDSFVQNGWAYLSLSNEFPPQLRILDVSNLPAMIAKSSTATPGGLTHSAWADDEDKICVTTDENHGGGLAIYDVANKGAPQLLGTWYSPSVPKATLHYQYLADKVVQMAAYSDGYWAIDLSVPSSPKPIAHYDTNPYTGSDYLGAWGCYPLQPSGVVYVSDMQTGFWILEPTCGVPRIYGDAAAGKGGYVPRIEYAGGCAQVANAGFMLNGRSMIGGSPAALLVGIGPANLSIAGIPLNIDPTLPNVALGTSTSGVTGTPGTGTTTLGLAVPNQPGMAGHRLYAQWLVVDQAAANGLLAVSRGFAVGICP